MTSLKNSYIILSVFTALISMLFIETYVLRMVTAQRDSYRKDTEVLLSDIDTFRTRNGELASKVADLELTKRDFSRMMSEDAKRIDGLKKKNEELERLVKSNIETKVEIRTVVKDSIVYIESTPNKVQVIDWEDAPWEKFHAEIYEGRTANVRMSHKDEVDVLVLMEYKKFLWWKTKLKGCNVEVVSSNPYTEKIDVSSISVIK